MSSLSDLEPEVARYLEAVREGLGDLTDAERDDLLEEVESSLLEAAADSGSVQERLGPPEEFAAELRSAAGLEAPPVEPTRERGIRDVLAELAAAARSPRLRRFASELTPTWWLARGYVAVAFLGFLGFGWTISHREVPRLHNGKLGLLAIAVAVVLSFWLGRRARGVKGTARVAVVAANIVLAAAAIPLAVHLAHSKPAAQSFVVYVPAVQQAGLLNNGAAVTNIYPYTRDGKFLHDVLLFDGAGNPIQVGANFSDPNRRLLRTAGRYAAIYNSFPIRYYDPGTTRVSHPNAAPRVRIPSLVPGPER